MHTTHTRAHVTGKLKRKAGRSAATMMDKVDALEVARVKDCEDKEEKRKKVLWFENI